MAVNVLEVTPALAWWFVLPLAVWVVYTLDHLIDDWGKTAEGMNHTATFHIRHRYILLVVVFLITAFLLLLSWLRLSSEVFTFGMILGILILLYAGLLYLLRENRQKLIPKKVFVSLVYTAGVWGAPLMLSEGDLQAPQIIILLLFWMLALANTSLFSLFESAKQPISDAKDDEEKAFKGSRSKFTGLILILTMFLAFLSMFYQEDFSYDYLFALSILVVMDMVMFIMLSFPDWFLLGNRYKLAIEMVFFLPVLMIFS